MIETKSVEEIIARINEHRKIRDRYLEDFNLNKMSESAVRNYQHLCTRLDELSWVLKIQTSGERAKND